MMAEQEKQLLLKDLCSRLPYGVMCRMNGGGFETIEKDKLTAIGLFQFVEEGLECVPFLRPMSSITDEEKAQAQMFMDIVTDEKYGDGYSPSAWDAMNGFVRYCDSHHLDHRGLIVKSLALEAPEGMYNF